SRAKAAGAKRGYTYLHSAVDGFSRLAYTEPLSDEKGATAAAFLARAKVGFAAHGITHIHRVVTDNGACYRSGDFAWIVGKSTRHQKTKPYTPQHNGKVERYQRILAEELLYARNFNSEEDRSSAISVWNIHYNYHRRHSGAGGWPPASRLREGVTNVQPSYIYAASRACDMRETTPAPVTGAVIAAIRETVPGPGPDRFLSPELAETIAKVKDGSLVAAAEAVAEFRHTVTSVAGTWQPAGGGPAVDDPEFTALGNLEA